MYKPLCDRKKNEKDGLALRNSGRTQVRSHRAKKSNKNREPDNKQWLKMKEGTNERTEKSTESEGKE